MQNYLKLTCAIKCNQIAASVRNKESNGTCKSVYVLGLLKKVTPNYAMLASCIDNANITSK
jgi:hypothetical protein